MIDTQEMSEYVYVPEACAILGVSRASLDTYARQGKLTKYQRGAPMRVCYKRSQLEVLKRVKPKYM